MIRADTSDHQIKQVFQNSVHTVTMYLLYIMLFSKRYQTFMKPLACLKDTVLSSVYCCRSAAQNELAKTASQVHILGDIVDLQWPTRAQDCEVNKTIGCPSFVTSAPFAVDMCPRCGLLPSLHWGKLCSRFLPNSQSTLCPKSTASQEDCEYLGCHLGQSK